MKTFVIGLSKTGTSTLEEALRLLGLSVVVFPRRLAEIESADAASDLSVAINFKRLDSRFPGSRFIYSERALPDWLASCEAMWRRQQQNFDADPFVTAVHKAAYGGADFEAARFAEHYAGHASAVDTHFADRQGDLLRLDISKAAGWDSLCAFLGRPAPDTPFPHANRASDIERFAAHILCALGDRARTAELLSLSEEELSALPAYENEGAFSLQTRNWELDRMLWRLHQAYGSIEAAGEALNLDPRLLTAWRRETLPRNPLERVKRKLGRLTQAQPESSPWF